ncbi:MobA-like NTP transferase protein [Paraburkholderia caballeronis]|nr:MobA-like NTP transferase protein [Paraburkholderia caballeronis]TDV20650.1 MobA-like NTP transferase protein [Paraburkholderia caballeronis]TDV33118.1 MobA-like NTP transferase protein [Paraburkholderia caballeronis]
MDCKGLTVIIQAGGRGSRLRHHTWNKPKCLVSVRGKPILYHTLEYFKGARFIIIGDYLFEQIEKYLQINPTDADYELVKADGKGTLSGIRQAVDRVSPDSPVLLVWSDLIIHSLPEFADSTEPVVLTTAAFTCRWSVSDAGSMHEHPSATRGIPGVFYFPQATQLAEAPGSGEFAKWLAASQAKLVFRHSDQLEELGEFVMIERNNDREGFSRFFNKVEIEDDIVRKTVIDSAFADLHEKEKAWYREASNLGFRRIPQIHGLDPLVMGKIHGRHLFQIKDLNPREQRSVFADYIDSLTELHDKIRVPSRSGDVRDVYIDKTLKRIESIINIIPNRDKKHITINGKKCRNFYHEQFRDIFFELLPSITPEFFFSIHGDPTFSNTLVDDKLRIWYIDPRGYFSRQGIAGDQWYDFAKLYYSAVGSYDAFNRKQFKLHVDEETVEILLEEPQYIDAALSIFNEYFPDRISRIEIIHGLLWLSLSGYVKDDIDSIIGSYYLGMYWLEKALERA